MADDVSDAAIKRREHSDAIIAAANRRIESPPKTGPAGRGTPAKATESGMVDTNYRLPAAKAAPPVKPKTVVPPEPTGPPPKRKPMPSQAPMDEGPGPAVKLKPSVEAVV